MPRRLRSLLLLLPAVTACYNLRPIAVGPAGFTETLPVGAGVEAVLSVEGTTGMTATIGPDAATLIGTVTAFGPDTVRLAVAEVRTRAGLSYFLRGTVVPVGRQDLAQLRVRELDRPRTAIATAIGLGAAGALIYHVRFGGGGTQEGPGPTPTPALTPP